MRPLWPVLCLGVSMLLAACGQDLQCGTGTINQDGVCLPQPQGARSAKLTYLKVQQDLSQPIYTGRLVLLSFGVTATGSPGNTNVTFGLMERPKDGATAADRMGLAHCALKGFDLELAGNGEEQIFQEWVNLPRECIEDGTERTFNLFASFDGSTGTGQSVVFNRLEAQAAPNQACRNDQTTSPERGCVYDVRLAPTTGLDIEFNSLDVRSSVAVLYPAGSHPQVLPGMTEYNTPAISLVAGLRFFGHDPALPEADVLPQPVRIRYEILPEALTTGWRPLMLQSKTENAVTLSPDAEVTNIPPEREYLMTHELHIDGDTYKAIQEGGGWSTQRRFLIRGCIDVPFAQVGDAGDGIDGKGDDCRIISVLITRALLNPPAASNYSFDASFNRTFGNAKTMALDLSARTSHVLNLSGAQSDSEVSARVRGILGERPVVRGFAQAAAFVSLVDSGVHLGLEVFGNSLYKFDRVLPSLMYQRDFSVAKQLCSNLRFAIGPVPLSASVCLTGTAGLDANLSILARDGAGSGVFSTATKIGEVTGAVIPFADFSGSASVQVDILIARAGAEGKLTLFKADAPIRATLNWGQLSLAPPRLRMVGNVKFDLKLSSLAGTVNLFADLRSIDMCSVWGVPYPCGLSFKRIGTLNLFSFKGETKTFPLLNRQQQIDLE